MKRLALVACALPALIVTTHSAEAKYRKSPRHHHHYRIAHDPAVRRSDLTPTLAAKVGEIQSACGSHLISAYRPGARVAGSGHPSLHSVYPARAADMSGNPSCIYAHLRGWQGGYSIDYGRVRHVHVSWSPPGSGHLAGREWHARFAHYGGGHHRMARRSHELLGSLDYHPAPARGAHVQRRFADRAHDYALQCGLMDNCR